MSATTATAAPALDRRPAGAGLGASVATITGRNLRRLLRVPTLLVFATIQPVMFVLLFTYTYGGAIHPPGWTATSTTSCPASTCWPSPSAPPKPASPWPTT